jgi:hypothetical protein
MSGLMHLCYGMSIIAIQPQQVQSSQEQTRPPMVYVQC